MIDFLSSNLRWVGIINELVVNFMKFNDWEMPTHVLHINL